MLKTALMQMKKVFSPDLILQAEKMQSLGYVLHLRLGDGLLKARVRSEQGKLYDVYLDLRSWPQVPARCRCETYGHCEHAAACLLALQAREHYDIIPQHYPTAPERLIDVTDWAWFSELEPGHHDYFSYQLGILVEGKPVNIVPLVADILRQFNAETLQELSDDHCFRLSRGDGTALKIPLARIKPLLQLLMHYGIHRINEQQFLKISAYQLLLLHEAEQAMAATQARWYATEPLRQQLQSLTQLQHLPPELPQSLQTTLRDYQRQGLQWLQGLRAYGFGGVLADDMGLGKTIQTLAHLLCEKEQGRLTAACLIVAPTSLLWNWYEEAKKFAPTLRTKVYHGASRHDLQFADFDVLISTYGLIQRDKAKFLKYPFYYVILDEAQWIKNARTLTTQVVQQLQATHRLCLTGTPLENHLGELWSLFHFLMPGLLGTAKQFRQHFRVPIERHGDQEQQQRLVKRIQPFLLRRSKNEVMKELPQKTEMIHRIELLGAQRDVYESIRMSMESHVREAISQQGLARSQMVLLDALLKLRQVCCDPRLVKLPDAHVAHGVSAKLDALMVLVDSLLAEGRRILIFSQFTSMLALIEQALQAKKYHYLLLTGKTKNRQQLVESFQRGDAPIFLISLKAGGTGLNLTRADTVIHYDPWWNPAVEIQATDRTHRMGQENPVFVYKLITAGTVEEVIQSMQAKKQHLFDGILAEQPAQKWSLQPEDIEQFFAPLHEL